MGYGLKEPLNLTDFVMHLGTIIVGSSRERAQKLVRAPRSISETLLLALGVSSS